MFEYIKSDLYRYSGKVSNMAFIKCFLCNPFYRYTVYLRLSKINNFLIRGIFLFLKSNLSKKTSIQISQFVNIGYGLCIPHGNVVINSTATIGDNFTMMQFSSIGSMNGTAAKIGNNVYVGPSACIVENVTIASNVIIGAGAVVVNDIAENLCVAGVPAKPINSKRAISVAIYNKWEH